MKTTLGSSWIYYCCVKQNFKSEQLLYFTIDLPFIPNLHDLFKAISFLSRTSVWQSFLRCKKDSCFPGLCNCWGLLFHHRNSNWALEDKAGFLAHSAHCLSRAPPRLKPNRMPHFHFKSYSSSDLNLKYVHVHLIEMLILPEPIRAGIFK